MHFDLDDVDTDMEERKSTRPERPLSIRAPPIQMMPFTGELAKDLFNAKFKIRRRTQYIERTELRKRQKQESRTWLNGAQQVTTDPVWVNCTGKYDTETGRAKVVQLKDVGKFKVSSTLVTRLSQGSLSHS